MGREERFRKEIASLEDRLTLNERLVAESVYCRLEALTAIYHTLDIKLPLPPMRGYALSPEASARLVTEILTAKPSVILELGSGVSTLLAGYALKKVDYGRIFSLEHDPKYLAVTRQRLADHGIAERVELVPAQLTTVELQEGPWQWYDFSTADLPGHIDLLIVDGPPADIQPLSRYPALPILHSRLSESASIILDDAARPDEAEIARRWLKTYPELVAEPIASKEGALFFQRGETVID